jgi:hypothetical protein
LACNERLGRSEERGKRKEEGQSGDAAFSVLTFLFPPSSRHPALLEALVSAPTISPLDAKASFPRERTGQIFFLKSR